MHVPPPPVVGYVPTGPAYRRCLFVNRYTIDSIDDLGPVASVYAWRRVRQPPLTDRFADRASIQTP
jgi:hypothetical protein